MSDISAARLLCSEPEHWDVEFASGETMTVLAHGYRVDRDDVVFSLLFEGQPNFEVESLRIPLSLMPPGFS